MSREMSEYPEGVAEATFVDDHEENRSEVIREAEDAVWALLEKSVPMSEIGEGKPGTWVRDIFGDRIDIVETAIGRLDEKEQGALAENIFKRIDHDDPNDGMAAKKELFSYALPMNSAFYERFSTLEDERRAASLGW